MEGVKRPGTHWLAGTLATPSRHRLAKGGAATPPYPSHGQNANAAPDEMRHLGSAAHRRHFLYQVQADRGKWLIERPKLYLCFTHFQSGGRCPPHPTDGHLLPQEGEGCGGRDIARHATVRGDAYPAGLASPDQRRRSSAALPYPCQSWTCSWYSSAGISLAGTVKRVRPTAFSICRRRLRARAWSCGVVRSPRFRWASSAST